MRKHYLDKHSEKEFLKSRTLKLLVPSTIGLFVFQFIQGYVFGYVLYAIISRIPFFRCAVRGITKKKEN